jgi:hypothetical protein
MTKFEVPIDKSNVKSIIPPGEDIVFSTMFRGKKPISGGTIRWTTHALITTKGIAYYEAKGNDFSPVRHLVKYNGLRDVKIITKGLKVTGGRVLNISFTFMKFSNETNKEYKQRIKSNLNELTPTIESATQFWNEKIPKKKEYKNEIKMINQNFQESS